ncbi:MAG: hypothetical protein H7839_03500 [Magnetococcus sp. YQC-5]
MLQKVWLRESVVLIGLVVVITLLCLPLLMMGPQSGHSFFFNLSWTKGFAETVAEGVFYPRWLPHMHQEAGSPVFFYYAPFPYYLTTLGRLLCHECTISQHLGFGMWLIMLLSGLAFYIFARQHVRHVPALVSTFFYIILPYHFYIDLLQRQAIGETSVYIFMPLALLAVKRLSDGLGWVAGVAVAFAMTLFSHLPGTLLFSPFLFLYAVLIAYKMGNWRSMLPRFMSGIVLGILLSGIYLIPALTLQEYIHFQKWWSYDYYHFMRWFIFGSVDSRNPQMLQDLKELLSAVTILTGLLVWSAGRKQRNQTPWILFLIGSWFFMTSISAWLWDLLPILQKVQFPFRTAIIFDLAIALIIMQALAAISCEHPIRLAIATGICVALCLVSLHKIHDEYRNQLHLSTDKNNQNQIHSVIATGFDAPEYLPQTVKEYRHSPFKVQIVDKNGTFRVEKWISRHIVLQMDLPEPAKIIVHQFYFPGWQAQIADSTQCLTASTPDGLIQVNAPAGQYRLHLTLKKVPAEQVGAIASLIGLTGILILLAIGIQKRIIKKT